MAVNWRVYGPDTVAAVLDKGELPGFFRQAVVGPNEAALVIRNGRIEEVVTETVVRTSGFRDRLAQLVGQVRDAQVILVDTSPVELEFYVGEVSLGRPGSSTVSIMALSADRQPITAQVTMTVAVEIEDAELLTRLLRGRAAIAVWDLAALIHDELLAKVLIPQVGQHRADELRGNTALLRQLERSVEEKLGAAAALSGLTIERFFLNWGVTEQEVAEIGLARERREIESEDFTHQRLIRERERSLELERVHLSNLQELRGLEARGDNDLKDLYLTGDVERDRLLDGQRLDRALLEAEIRRVELDISHEERRLQLEYEHQRAELDLQIERRRREMAREFGEQQAPAPPPIVTTPPAQPVVPPIATPPPPTPPPPPTTPEPAAAPRPQSAQAGDARRRPRRGLAIALVSIVLLVLIVTGAVGAFLAGNQESRGTPPPPVVAAVSQSPAAGNQESRGTPPPPVVAAVSQPPAAGNQESARASANIPPTVVSPTRVIRPTSVPTPVPLPASVPNEASTVSSDTLVIALDNLGFEAPVPWLSSPKGLASLRFMYDPLIGLDEYGHVSGLRSLASSWEIEFTDSGDWLYTFALEAGIPFHHSSDKNFEAWDSVITIQNWNAYGGSFPRTLLEYGSDGPRRLIVNTTELDISLFTDSWWGIGMAAPAVSFEEHDGFIENPSGTGPYKYGDFDGTTLELEAVTDHWREGTPAIPNVWFHQMGHDQRIAALRGGEVDIARVGLDWVNHLQEEGFNIHYRGAGETFGFLLHRQRDDHEPLSDIRVRLALNLAINREALAQAFFRGAARPAGVPFVPVSLEPGEFPDPYAYDPDRAHELLWEAGYADGLALIIAPLDGFYDYTGAENPIDGVAWDLSRIGIELEVDSVSPGFVLDRSKEYSSGHLSPLLIGPQSRYQWFPMMRTLFYSGDSRSLRKDQDLENFFLETSGIANPDEAGPYALMNLVHEKAAYLPLLQVDVPYATSLMVPEDWHPGLQYSVEPDFLDAVRRR